MNQTSYSPDKFGTYLSHPGSQGCDINLSSANVLEILLAYRAFRQTLNASYSNDTIVRKIRQLEKEFSCTLEPRYYKSRMALTSDEICHIAHFDISKVGRGPQYRKTLERVRDMFVLLCNLGQRYSDIVRISPENFERNMFRIIQKKTGSKAIVNIDKYAIIPRLTYKLPKKYNYCNPCTSHTGRRTFISYNVMRCPTEAEVRKCSGHKSMKIFERYITFDED